MIKRRIAAIAAATSMMATMASVQAFAELSSATFTPTASAASVAAGEEVTITVNLESADIASWTAFVNYDAAAFDVVSASAIESGVMLDPSNTGASWFATEDTSYSGSAFSVTFRAKATAANGLTTFTVSGSNVYNAAEQEAGISVGEVTVNITGGSDPVTDSSEGETSTADSSEAAPSQADSSEAESSSTADSSSTASTTSSSTTSSAASTTSSSTASSASSAASSSAASSSSRASTSNAGGSSSGNKGKTDNPKTGVASIAGAAAVLALGIIVVAKKRK